MSVSKKRTTRMEKIITHYKSLNLTLNDVASSTGLSRQHLSKVLHCHTDMTAKIAIKLEQALDIPRWEIAPEIFIANYTE